MTKTEPIRILLKQNEVLYRLCRIEDIEDSRGEEMFKMMFTDVGPVTFMSDTKFQESTGTVEDPATKEVVNGATELSYHYVAGIRHFKLKDANNNVVYRARKQCTKLNEAEEPVLVCRAHIGSLTDAYKFTKKIGSKDQIIDVQTPCSLRFYYSIKDGTVPHFKGNPIKHHFYFDHEGNEKILLTILYLKHAKTTSNGFTIFTGS